MIESIVPVDLFNPGQVLACLGLVEATQVLTGEARGIFDWSAPLQPRFRIAGAGSLPPLRVVLDYLDRASVRAEAVAGSEALAGWKSTWGPTPSTVARSRGYPYPDRSAATFVAVLDANGQSIRIDHWGDATVRDAFKLWAGSGGYPGAAFTRDALELYRQRDPHTDVANNPFAFSAPQSSSFRLDWRRDYVPIDLGHSLNSQGDGSQSLGFPLVEVLAAIGLGQARPRRVRPRDKLHYTYAVAGRAHAEASVWLPPRLLRAALGGTELPCPMRHFSMRLDWPGQEGQARAITTVTEEIRA